MTLENAEIAGNQTGDRDIIYISVNNWFRGRDYPDTPQFIEWLRNDLKQTFQNDGWARENKLCIRCGYIDMSFNYLITAPRDWVQKNCPELLTDDEYSYDIISGIDGRVTYHKRYADFVYAPDSEGKAMDRFGWPFLEYSPENYGVQWYEEPDEEYPDDSEEEE